MAGRPRRWRTRARSRAQPGGAPMMHTTLPPSAAALASGEQAAAGRGSGPLGGSRGASPLPARARTAPEPLAKTSSGQSASTACTSVERARMAATTDARKAHISASIRVVPDFPKKGARRRRRSARRQSRAISAAAAGAPPPPP